ncbi:MAG: hypothetical protein RIS94_3275 [Pseudomonadota bacterium]|jgi:head-tail adaptor
MRIGRMDTRVQLLRYTATGRSALNEPIYSHVADGLPFWAQQVSQRPIEAWKAGQSASQLETVFMCRFSARTASIGARDRIVAQGITYEVIGDVKPDRKRTVTITCISVPQT